MMVLVINDTFLWLSLFHEVSRFFKRLDRRAEKAKSKQSKQQTLPRFETEEPSGRPKPLEYSDDFFGFSAT